MAISLPTILQGGASIFSLLGGLRSSRSASKAAADQARLTDAQIDQMEMLNRIFGEGSDALASAFDSYISSVGGSGFFDPAAINDMASMFANERALERYQTRGEMNDILSSVPGAVTGDMLRTTQLARMLSPATAGNVDAPNVDVRAAYGGHDSEIAELMASFQGIFDQNTQRAADEIYAQTEAAAIRSGNEGSTAGNDARRQAAGMVAQRRNDDTMRALEAAMATVGGRQQIAGAAQGHQLSQLGGELNMAEFQRALEALGFDQNLQGLAAASGLKGTSTADFWTNRQGALSEMGAIESLLPQDLLRSISDAIGVNSGLGDLRSRSLGEVSTLATAPYTFRAGGSEAIATLGMNASRNAANAFATHSANAGTAFNAAGQGLDSLFKNIDWNALRPSRPAPSGAGNPNFYAT